MLRQNCPKDLSCLEYCGDIPDILGSHTALHPMAACMPILCFTQRLNLTSEKCPGQ